LLIYQRLKKRLTAALLEPADLRSAEMPAQV